MPCTNCTCYACEAARKTPRKTGKCDDCKYRTDVAYGHPDWFVCTVCRVPYPGSPHDKNPR